MISSPVRTHNKGQHLAVDPFDSLRHAHSLAPHDVRLNDLRWLVGAALRRVHHRARFDQLQSLDLALPRGMVGQRFAGLPEEEGALHARDQLNELEIKVGPAAWPIVYKIVIQGARVRECRDQISDVAMPWRADAIIIDRLRVALDVMGPLLSVTP